MKIIVKNEENGFSLKDITINDKNIDTEKEYSILLTDTIKSILKKINPKCAIEQIGDTTLSSAWIVAMSNGQQPSAPEDYIEVENKVQIEQEIIKRKKIIMPLFVIIFILSSFVFVKFLLNRMNTYIEVNGEISMEAVVEQIQQTYDMQVSGYYRQLHFVEGYLCKEKKISLETDNNRIFFEAWEKETESTLLFLQENGKAITSDGTKLKVDMPSELLLDLRKGSNIGKLVALEFEQGKKDGYLVAIPCQEYTINGETYTAIGTVYDHSKLDSMLNLGGYDGSAYLFMLDDDGNITYTNQKDDIFFRNYSLLKHLKSDHAITEKEFDSLNKKIAGGKRE